MSRIDSILSGSLIFRDKGTYLSEIRPGTDKVTVTGSLQITGSNLLLNGKDLGNAIGVLEAGQGADQVKFGAILLYTASISEWTSSIKEYTSSLATTASNTFIGTQTISGSIIPEATAEGNGIYNLGSQTAPFRDLYLSTSSLHFIKDGQVVVDLTGQDNALRIGNLLLGTASISIVNAAGAIVDTIYSVDLDGEGEVVKVDQQSLPLGIVSSSAQISDLGFLSGSISGIVSRSAQISDLGFITGSKFSQLDDIPQGIVSSSVQIDELFNLDGIISSSTQLEAEISGAFAAPSSSFSTRVTDLEYFSSSLDSTYATDAQLTSLSQSIADSVGTDLNALSSSVSDQITVLTSSLTNLSSSITQDVVILSSSIGTRVTGLEAFSSSLDATYATDVQLSSVSGALATSIDSTATTAASNLSSTSASLAGSITSNASTAASNLSNVSASLAVSYVTASSNPLTEIKVNDFDDAVAVDYTGGRLTLTFGTPTPPSGINATLSGFNTNRFNQVIDTYNVNGSWSSGGYLILTASLYEGTTLLTEVNSGGSLSFTTSSIGNHTYKLIYTASSPLDGTIFTGTDTVTGNLSKSNPSTPSLNTTPTVQLGYSSNQIEQGATGSITITSSSSNPSNNWELDRTETNFLSPYAITGSAAGSSTISITATAYYDSPSGDNSPNLSTTSQRTNSYSKIRSVRYGASAATTFTANELADLSLWDSTLGGNIGTINKGNTNPSGDAVTISFSGDKYHYIVYDSSRSNLSNITTSGFGVLGQFTVSTVGQYKIYRTTTLQAGGVGSSITYNLT